MTDPEFDVRFAGDAEPTVDLADALSYCEHAMRKLRALQAAADRIDEDHRAQLAEIKQWHKQESGRLLGEMHRMRLEMQPRVRALVAADPMGRKSVELVAGRAGFRRSPAKLVVEDEDAAIDWLDVHRDGEFVRTKRSVDIAALKAANESVPGVRLEPGDDSFWTELVG